ncbi:recombination mediator RecR [Patescibacteria group bacterium]|nr:recombination mediator RecR [Patescibacteria group bacterium]
MYPKAIQKLIDIFSKFPTVGPRTATRFVFYLMKTKKEEIEDLIKSITNLKKRVKICPFCFNPFEGEDNLCKICSDSSGDKTLLCIVEKETDLTSIEKTKKYKGLYFILGGTVSKLKKQDLKKLKIKELTERIKNPQKFGISDAKFKEIIIATNPTTEGEATALYLERILKPLTCGEPAEPIKITRLGRGLPVGAELEYADKETLGSALEGRK